MDLDGLSLLASHRIRDLLREAEIARLVKEAKSRSEVPSGNVAAVATAREDTSEAA